MTNPAIGSHGLSIVTSSSLPLCCSKGHIYPSALNQFTGTAWIAEKHRMKMQGGERGRSSPPSGECPSSSVPAPLGAGPSRLPSDRHAALPCGPVPGRQRPEGFRRSSQTNQGSVKSRERMEQLRELSSVRGARRMGHGQCHPMPPQQTFCSVSCMPAQLLAWPFAATEMHTRHMDRVRKQVWRVCSHTCAKVF